MRFNVVDIETTGLNSSEDEIIEIGAVKFDQGKEVSRFSALIKPSKEIKPEALLIHKITMEDLLVSGKEMGTVLPQLRDFCGDDPNVGHNFPNFDLKFIDRATELTKIAAPTGAVFCSHELAKKVLEVPKDVINRKLVTLLTYYKIPVEGELHRAVNDCFYNGLVFLKLMEDANLKSFSQLAEILKSKSFYQPQNQMSFF